VSVWVCVKIQTQASRCTLPEVIEGVLGYACMIQRKQAAIKCD
jgi:hypothetical protein